MKPAVGEVLEALNLLEAGQHRPLFPLGTAAPHRRIDSSVLPLRGKGMLRKPLAGLRT
jgi:hypothetical protein